LSLALKKGVADSFWAFSVICPALNLFGRIAGRLLGSRRTFQLKTVLKKEQPMGFCKDLLERFFSSPSLSM
jgi:hypothetical protein